MHCCRALTFASARLFCCLRLCSVRCAGTFMKFDRLTLTEFNDMPKAGSGRVCRVKSLLQPRSDYGRFSEGSRHLSWVGAEPAETLVEHIPISYVRLQILCKFSIIISNVKIHSCPYNTFMHAAEPWSKVRALLIVEVCQDRYFTARRPSSRAFVLDFTL